MEKMSIIELSLLYCVHSSSTLLINFFSYYDFFLFWISFGNRVGHHYHGGFRDERWWTRVYCHDRRYGGLHNQCYLVYHLQDLRESRQVVYSRHYCDRHGLWRDNRAGRSFRGKTFLQRPVHNRQDKNLLVVTDIPGSRLTHIGNNPFSIIPSEVYVEQMVNRERRMEEMSRRSSETWVTRRSPRL